MYVILLKTKISIVVSFVYMPQRDEVHQISNILRSAHTVYLCVLFGSENKQRLFPYTALTDWFL